MPLSEKIRVFNRRPLSIYLQALFNPNSRQLQLPSLPSTVLYMTTVVNVRVYLGAHVTRGSSSHVNFDSDAIKIILNIWCLFTISIFLK